MAPTSHHADEKATDCCLCNGTVKRAWCRQVYDNLHAVEALGGASSGVLVVSSIIFKNQGKQNE